MVGLDQTWIFRRTDLLSQTILLVKTDKPHLFHMISLCTQQQQQQ